MKNVLLIVTSFGIVLGVLGCNRAANPPVYQPPVETSYSAEPTNPDEALATQLREGSVQMSASLESLESALQEAKRVSKHLSGEGKEAMLDIVDLLNDAGSTIGDASGEPPTLEAIRADFATNDDLRKKAISDGNEAYRSLEQAMGTLQSLETGVEGLDTLGNLITLTMDDLGDGIEAYGGQVETESDTGGSDSEPKG